MTPFIFDITEGVAGQSLQFAGALEPVFTFYSAPSVDRDANTLSSSQLRTPNDYTNISNPFDGPHSNILKTTNKLHKPPRHVNRPLIKPPTNNDTINTLSSGAFNVFKTLTLIISSLLLLTACGSNGDPIEETRLTRDKNITVGSDTRNYHLFLPDRPESAAIVFLLHGHGGSADQILGLEGTKAPFRAWTDIALRENLILVVPDGEFGSDDKKGWNDCRTDARTNPPTDDLRFLTNLLDRVIADFSTGNPKVYINGISNGGFMAQKLADETPGRLDAVAVIVTSRPTNSDCTVGTQPLPILFMNGTDDPILPYYGGNIVDDRGAVMSTPATIDHWVNRNQTDPTPIQTTITNSSTEDGSTIQRFSYFNGTNGAVVEHYEVVGGGHTEPSILERYANIYKLIVGSQNGDIEMAEEVWKFFAAR